MRILSVLLVLCFSNSLFSQEIRIYYSATQAPVEYHDDYFAGFQPKLLAEDLARLLCCATGKKYIPSVYNGETKGVFLLIDSLAPASRNETGHVAVNGDNIFITARNAAGISYAMYSWLHETGFRFYLPGDEWMLTPDIKGNFKNIRKTYSPHFKLRMFNASGGSFAVAGLDDKAIVKKEWNTWYRRNRMGSDYLRIDGHKGELFNIVHRKELEADPSILAPVDGKRKFDVNAKLDPTNPHGVNMFTSWLLTEYKKSITSTPSFLPFKKYQSADLGDGLNYCHTPECEDKFPSVSDQAFFIVNEAARKLKDENKNAGVSTLAYTERTDTPGFKIEDNVHVMITPTAFQQVSIPTELMHRWSTKHGTISQYDFLNIGVWNYDHPFFNLSQYHSYMEYLKSLNIEGMCFETSLSSMASGLQQYLLMKYLAEPFQDIDVEFSNWCNDLFGKASEPVKEILRKWYFSDAHLKTSLEKNSFYPDELAEFIHLLRKAENTKGLSMVEKDRIHLLKAYLVYLCAFYELHNEQGISDETLARKTKADHLLNYTWSLYDTKIFHNTQLNDLLRKLASDKNLWDFRKGTTIAKIRPLSPAQSEQSFSGYEAKYKSFYVPPVHFGTEEMKMLLPFSADSIKIETVDENSFNSYSYPLKVYADKPGKIRIKYKTGKSEAEHSASSPISMVALEENGGKLLEQKFAYDKEPQGSLEFELPYAGNYTLQLVQFHSTPVSWMIFPQGHLLYVEKKSLIHHAIKLITDKKEGYQNYQIGVWNNNSHFRFQPVFNGVRNTVSFFTADEKPVNTYFDQKTKSYIVQPQASRLPFSFYRNEIFRWPAVLQNIPPYFFFLKSASN